MFTRTIASIALAGLLLASCAQTGPVSSSPAASASPTTRAASSPSGTATASATATTAGSSASPGNVRSDACQLSRSDVESVIGTVTSQQARTDVVPGMSTSMNVTSCVFTSNDGAMTFAVTRASVSRADFEAAVKQVPGVQAEPGVGDTAFSGTVSATGAGLGSATSFFVLKGSTYFTMQAASRSKDGSALLSAIRSVAQKVAATL